MLFAQVKIFLYCFRFVTMGYELNEDNLLFMHQTVTSELKSKALVVAECRLLKVYVVLRQQAAVAQAPDPAPATDDAPEPPPAPAEPAQRPRARKAKPRKKDTGTGTDEVQEDELQVLSVGREVGVQTYYTEEEERTAIEAEKEQNRIEMIRDRYGRNTIIKREDLEDSD